MRYDENRTPLHQSIHPLLHDRLSTGIDRTSRLVKDHQRRIRNRRTCDGNQLPLPLRQATTVTLKHRLIPVGKHPDETIGIGELRRLDTLPVGRIELPVTDIVHHRPGEQIHVLQHDPHAPAQIGLTNLVDVDTVVADLAVGDIVETIDQVGDRSLARTGRPDERHLLPRLRIQGNVPQYKMIGIVAEIDIEQANIAPLLSIGHRTVRMRMPPSPAMFAFPTLLKTPVIPYPTIDQRHVAIVRFDRLIEQVEDPRSPGERHDYHVELHGNLSDRIDETA